MKWILTPILSLLLLSFTSFHPADAIVGVWKNGTGKGHIQIFKQGGRYHGKIVWLKDALDKTGKPKTDFKNEDPSKHNRPLLGITMLRDFTFEDGQWSGGRIYNPGDGREYKALIRMKNPQTLTVRGYMGVTLLGKTDTWTRVR